MADAGTVQKYRLRAKSADKQEVISNVFSILVRSDPGGDGKLRNPRWGDGSKPQRSAHNEELTMQVDARGMDGKQVKFTVERLVSGAWAKFAESIGAVKDGVASTTVKAAHPAADGDASATGPAAPVPMRFRVELV